MKKYLSLLAGLIMACGTTNAQELNTIPQDSSIVKGVLPNGMTYYIRHNEEPKERASFYIIQNVGAVLENDEQNGLAHFLEHMAFNGTQHYPEKGILDYLEGYGVKFGENINAYTAQDQTVYMLKDIPVLASEGLIDSTLLILNDWSNYLLLDEKEIDAERGVISEEWRSRRNSSFRLRSQLMPTMYAGSPYATRDVIGDYKIINNFKPETIRAFYHDWYRTDLQAIAVIGDVDVKELEKKIVDLFSQIPAVENPKERKNYTIPDNEAPILARATDPEAAVSYISVMHKQAAVSKELRKSPTYLVHQMATSLYYSMLNIRLNKHLQEANPPYLGAYLYKHALVRSTDVWETVVVPKGNEYEIACQTAFMEVQKVQQHGFSRAELERAKIDLLAQYKQAVETKEKRKNSDLVQAMINNYLEEDAMPSVEWSYTFAQQVLPMISTAYMKAISAEYAGEKNLIISVTGPEREGTIVPQAEEILQLWNKSKATKYEAYIEEEVPNDLIKGSIEGGSTVKERKNKALGTSELYLSNGMKVILKPSKLEANSILMKCFSKGGTSMYEIDALPAAQIAPYWVNEMGISDYDPDLLAKILTGKIVGVATEISEHYEGLNGRCASQDLESLLQLIYLAFEAPRFDEAIFDAKKGSWLSYLNTRAEDPARQYNDSVNAIVSNYDPRTLIQDKAYVEQLNFKQFKTIYEERYGDPADFTMLLVGDFDLEKTKPLLEKYLGGIKSNGETEKWVIRNRPFEQDITSHFASKMEVPKASNTCVYVGEGLSYTTKNRIYLKTVTSLLGKKYLENIREKEGGTYGVSCYGFIRPEPDASWEMHISFESKPERADELRALVYQEIDSLLEGNIKQEDFIEIKRNLLKQYEEQQQYLSFWLGALSTYEQTGVDKTNKDFEKTVNKMTQKDIVRFASKLLKGSHLLEVIMQPEKQ